MTDLTKSLLDAISIIANKSIDEISSDKTIKAVVKKVVSTSEGKYLVGCDEGDYFYAYNQSGSKDVYQVDEQIYILVPKDDMSQKKFIIGRVKNDEEDVSSKKITSSLLNDYVIIGDNAVIENTYKEEDNIHVKRMQPLCLNSHAINDFYYCYLHNPIDDIEYNTINYPSVDIDEEMFFNSAKQAKALLLRAKFKADIDTSNIGNYGIIVNIAFADETNPQIDDEGNITYPPKLIAYVLDTNKMTGNPMKFYDYSSQYIISEFNGEKYLYIDSIVAFSEGFVDNSIEPHDENDDINIYIDNFEIIALDEVSAINGDYKLRLTAPLGNTVKTGKKDNLKIVATTTYLNQDITQNTVFYWGVKDPSVTFSHNNYHAKLGPGYRYINKDSRELELTPSELTAAENIFVCVAVYESDIVLKTLISLYNNNNKLNITIDSDQGTKFQFNEGNPTLTCLINGKTNNYQNNYSDDDFVFIWSKEDEDFGIILLSETESQLEANKQKELNECANNDSHLSDAGRSVNQVISYYSTRIAQIQDISYPDGIRKSRINCKLKNTNNYVTYSCSVYRAGIYIGYASITLQNFKEVVNNNYYITITNGTQVFQYDEAGISPASQKQQEPIEVLNLTAVFHSPQGAEVTPRKVRWIVPQENTLINIPTLGLETDFETGERYYQGNIFPLSIKDVYDNTFNNNQLIAVVTHADGTEYRQSTNLLFTKIGEIGTNGTNTVVKINELGTVPADEYLTIIKSVDITSTNPTEEKCFYNARNENNLYISTNNPILEADLYTNNTQILGHTTKWTLADGSKTQGYLYNIRTDDESNNCVITCENNINELDTRIVKAQTSLQGKYYYGFYSIPTIEYNENYDYENYPIKIMRNGTLKTILYDSNGTNPSYNDSQGIHVELPDWKETGYLEWTVESGAQTKQIINNETIISYNNPNILLSKNSKSKNGSKELKIDPSVENNEAYILEIQETGKNCAENASVNIKKYIDDFLVDIEKIVIDNLLSVYRKKELLQNRLIIFQEKAPDDTNIYIKTVYNKYKELLDKIEQEYKVCENKNKIFTEVYNSIQSIWKSEWPSIIVDTYTQSNANIDNIEQLIKKYQDAYDDRSNNDINNNIVEMPKRSETFKNSFITIINAIDDSYNTYVNENELTSQFNSILIEYIKILIAYISKIINDTKNLYIVSNNDENIDLYNIIKDKYNFIENNWNNQVGKYIYDILNTSDENIANIFDKIRDLYQIYQSSYIGVKKYQVSEDSELLNVWKAILNKEQIDLLKQIYIIPNETFNGLYMNNNVVGTAFIKDEYNNKIDIAKIYIPIIMTLNTYELAALNGWDGTSIEIGDDHIMTPQIGAGVKDDTTNTFTGMVMGAINNNSDINNNFKSDKIDKIGLVGYSNGKQSIFIDSKTGKATFGLPEDNNTPSGEGRIELIPGGVSKIGNWKIGSHFLYNIVNGSYERRKDKDDRSGNQQKLMIPHDKHGIILSSSRPYIHIKGEIYDKENLKGINYNDEYNDINPEDSLELRLDPGNRSLFSIVQHTSGFGDEKNKLFFGYGLKDTNIIRDYESNKNIGIVGEYEGNVEYYIYNLITDNNNYRPYYIEQNDCFNILNLISSTNVYQQTFLVTDNLSNTNFRKTSSNNPVFTINSNTGAITYNPNNLIWENNNIGFSNNEGWESVTKEETFFENFKINLKYYDEKNESFNISKKICNLKNNTNNNFHKIAFYYNYYFDLFNINFNNSTNNYVQFYIVDKNDEDNGMGSINNALLKSDLTNVIYKSNYDSNNKYIELSSYNGGFLSPNNTYCLKIYFYSNNYVIDCDYFCDINSVNLSYMEPPSSNLGRVEINSYTDQDFSSVPNDCNINFSSAYSYKWGYHFDKSQNIMTFYVHSPSLYDFIIWRKNSEIPIAVGFTSSGSMDVNSRQVKSTEWSLYSELTSSINIEGYEIPTIDDPWYITFYPYGTYTRETILYDDNNVKTTYFKLYDSVIDMNLKSEYSIEWKNWNTNSSKIVLKQLFINSIVGFKVENSSLLCIKTENEDIQGIPFAKTYWDNNKIKKIIFYKEYYDWINIDDNNTSQYAYIDISQNDNINYKYIKTLVKTKVNSWFEKNNLPVSWTGEEDNLNTRLYSYIEGPVNDNNDIKNAINWKEIIRIGLDENGRFFNSGLQDKSSYIRSGKIYAFGKTPDLYGQETRIQLSSNNYFPIIKIFTQMTNNNVLKTTYITRGQNDNGNISIRTTENNYVELAASKISDTGTGLIPDENSYIRVGYNIGIQFQIKDDNNNLINNINLTKSNGLDINVLKLSIISNNTQYQINNDRSQTTTLNYIVSSLPNSSFSSSLDEINTNGHYRIAATYDDNYNKQENSNINNPNIKLEVGKNNSGINIYYNNISLKSDSNHYMVIDSMINSTSKIFINNMSLEFNSKEAIIQLKNKNSYIQISNTDLINLKSNNGGKIDISGKIEMRAPNGIIFAGGMVTSQTNFYCKSNIYAYSNLVVGFNRDDITKSYGRIDLYDSCTNNQARYITLRASDLRKLLDWYCKRRWRIGVYGNSVYLANANNSSTEEGHYDSDSKRFIFYLDDNIQETRYKTGYDL